MMLNPTGRLFELVRKLDALGPTPSLVDLAGAMESAQLMPADVAAYVEPNSHHYNRALVAIREHYELLVMTWLPGQASPPHDHAGSICVMQVVEGDAAEGSFRVAPDGYVDFDYEMTIRSGEITAGQDAGVHTVRNPAVAGPPLVTVHVYAPPLKDFRRFIPRPPAPPVARRPPEAAPPTVVVIGGGFSGSMAAAQLLRRSQADGRPLRVVVVERRGAVGEGLAYGTREIAHLLNVPAGRMSAWPDRPDDFVTWASAQFGAVKPTDFLPRMWYGQYVRETLLAAARDAAPHAQLAVQYDEVRRVARRPDGGWLVHLARAASLQADAVVLAVGHRPPSDAIGKRWNGPRTRLIADPWRPLAMNVVRPDEPVIVLGSGLTAVDAALSLARPDRRATVTLLSRRGLMPQAHAAVPPKPVDLQPMASELIAAPGGVRVLELLRRLRQTAREVVGNRGDWRSVVDGLRPHTAALWQAMPLAERRKFLARLQPFWEVHRHRMALSIGERFGELRDCDWVDRVAGRVMSVQAEGDAIRVLVALRGSDRLVELEAAWLVNCTGPAPSNSAAANPAIGSLLVDGWLHPDELGLGLETTTDGNAVDDHGRVVPNLFVVGTLRKPAVWESTAVPELRAQAEVVAARALSHLEGAVVAESAHEHTAAH